MDSLVRPEGIKIYEWYIGCTNKIPFVILYTGDSSPINDTPLFPILIGEEAAMRTLVNHHNHAIGECKRCWREYT